MEESYQWTVEFAIKKAESFLTLPVMVANEN